MECCNRESLLNITQGTDVSLLLTLTKGGERFPVELSEQVQVFVVGGSGKRTGEGFTVGDMGKIAINLLGDNYSAGVYGIEVTGVLNNVKWRTFMARVIEYTIETVTGGAHIVSTGKEVLDVNMEVGYVSDIIPKRLSELIDDVGYALNADLLTHTENEDIHVTLEQKTAWDEHVINEDIHVTYEQKETWDNHVEDTVIHVTQEDKDRWDATAPIEPDEFWY